MFNKQLTIFLLGITAVPFSFAGNMGDLGCTSFLCAANGVGGVYATITGHYVQPAETGLGLVSDSWLYSSANGPVALSKPFNVDYKWAGSVRLGYEMPNSANNIEVNYLFLSNKTHAVNDFTDGSIGFGSILFPDASLPPTPGFVSDAFLKYEINQVDLKVGRKYSDMSGVFKIRSSLGVRYAELQHSLTFAAPGNMISRFSGTGPLLSVDTHYHLGYGLGLVSYLDYAMLAGQSNAHSYVFFGTNLNYEWPKKQRVVNNITARLGLDYVYAWSAANITLEVGYQFNQYFDAFDTIRGTTALGGGIQRIAGYETNNFAIQGPYVALTVHA